MCVQAISIAIMLFENLQTRMTLPASKMLLENLERPTLLLASKILLENLERLTLLLASKTIAVISFVCIGSGKGIGVYQGKVYGIRDHHYQWQLLHR